MNGEAVAYRELARVFLRLSVTAFGGPVAHIALAEDELVTRRRWLTRDHYLDLIAAANLIPGPNSTEVMIHVGHSLRGIPGALVSGACFIVPAFLITLALSAFYVSSGTLPQVAALFRGIQPVIVAVIASAGWRLLRSALQGRALWDALRALQLPCWSSRSCRRSSSCCWPACCTWRGRRAPASRCPPPSC